MSGPNQSRHLSGNEKSLQKNEVIVIDDDDDESDCDGAIDEEGAKKPLESPNCCGASLSTEKTEQLRAFMDISNTTKDLALCYLDSNDYDMERSIASFFDQQPQGGLGSFSQRHFSTASASSSNNKTQAAPSHLLEETIVKKSNRSSDMFAKTKPIEQQRGDTTTNNMAPSQLWNAICAATSTEEFFVDPDFPPATQSLDGRKRNNTRSAAEDANRIRCFCGVPAAARQVQSDGPNYGRFYLGCGQPKQRKRPPPRQKQKQNEEQREETKVIHANNKDINPKQQRHNDSKDPAAIRNPYNNKAKRNNESAMTTPTVSELQATQNDSPKPCNFFRWDPDGSIGAASDGDGYAASMRFSLLAWQHFGIHNGCSLYHTKVDPSQVQQGAVGNCWFLSALAVVAEKPYLVRQLLPHTELNKQGCYQINLCLDGRWTPIIVDSNLPVVVKDCKRRDQPQTNTITGKRGSVTRREGVPWDLCQEELVAFPAFCAAPDRQIWAPLVEKAYAKAHGSYAKLSGGFIAEGLFDLTGAPFETIIFAGNILDREELWARLLSFHEAGFLMGVATSKGGEGLVGGHAYSVLDVIVVPNKIIGEQLKVTDFFSSPSKRQKSEPAADEEVLFTGTRTTVRLVRIRNPWGKREWKGAWSANSEQWTKSLRKILGSNSNAEGDGTFFMPFEDMLERFHHMDICKTRQSWLHTSTDGCFVSQKDPLESSDTIFRIVPSQRTSAFVSLVQPKKRSNTGSTYWYIDPSMIILRRGVSKPHGDWVCEASAIVGVKRISSCEVFLDPCSEYICVPLSCMAGRKPRVENSAYRLCTYSAFHLSVETMDHVSEYRNNAVAVMHRELLRVDHKLLYPVATSGLLACFHGHGCVYFLAINGEVDRFLSLKFNLDVPKGIIGAFGADSGTHDIPPRSQKIIAMATGDGKFSAATSLKFSYISDSVHVHGTSSFQGKTAGLGVAVDVTLNADMLVESINQAHVSNRGGDSIDTYLWIPQLGSS